MNIINNKKSQFLVAILAFTLVLTPYAANADVLAPQKQKSLDVPIDKIICKEKFVKLENTKSMRVACVTPASAEKLIANGWAKSIDTKIITAMKNRAAVGEVKTISIVKEAGTSKRLDSTPTVGGYNFAFEVCAFDKTIRLPEVLIESDSQISSIKLVDKIDANTCQVSAAKIKASNPDTIKASLVNKGKISERIITLENKVQDLRVKLAAEKSSLSEMESKPHGENFAKEVDDITTTIKKLRDDLNAAREELNRFTFFFYASPAKINEYRQPLSFTGAAIEGASTKTLSITPQPSGNGYNVVFEACAGAKIIRAPIVDVKSDTDSRTIKLADKISPNTCQMGIAKLGAGSTEAITVKFANNANTGNQVENLEKEISDLKQDAADVKRELAELVRLAPDKRPVGSDEKITELTSKLADIRNKINSDKEQLARLLATVYK